MSLPAEIVVATTAAIEQAINAFLKLDPDSSAMLSRFDGKVIALRMEGAGLTLFCLPGNDGMNIMTAYEGPVDTTLSGRPWAMLRLALGDSRKVLFSGDVTISGDVELGQRFKQTLDRLDIDWEEHLARLSNDVVAHRAGHFAREVGSWLSNASERLSRDGAEYLQQEVYTTPTRADVEVFYRGVETLRDDVERLAARIQMLASRLDKNAD
jgi:ubiquinone biosynthesis protein UbiJ